jgi:hypothetical protein
MDKGSNSRKLRRDRFVQRRTTESDAYSLFTLCQAEKVAHRRRGQNTHQHRFHCGIFVDTGQRQLPHGGRMNGIVENRQSRRVLRFRVYPQQDLVGQLIAGGCGGLAKRKVQDIAFRIMFSRDRGRCIFSGFINKNRRRLGRL